MNNIIFNKLESMMQIPHLQEGLLHMKQNLTQRMHSEYRVIRIFFNFIPIFFNYLFIYLFIIYSAMLSQP